MNIQSYEALSREGYVELREDENGDLCFHHDVIDKIKELEQQKAELIGLLQQLWNISSVPDRYIDKAKEIESQLDFYMDELLKNQ